MVNSEQESRNAWQPLTRTRLVNVLKLWNWHNGRPYFGVPLSNFFGWYLTVFADGKNQAGAEPWRSTRLDHVRSSVLLGTFCPHGKLEMILCKLTPPDWRAM